MTDAAMNKETQEGLLAKIKATREHVARQLNQAASDEERLYHLANQPLLNKFEALLSSNTEESQIKEELKQWLIARWDDIKGSSQTYCLQPHEPLNQLCLALALYIHPLPEDLDDCDDWDVDEGPYFILMPDLKACKDIAGTNIHQFQLHEFILSEQGTRYIPIVDTLQYFLEGSSKKPLHMVFTDEQMNDAEVDKTNDPLVEVELEWLTHHSELTEKLIEKLAILKDPESSFYNRLNKLADGLLAGSSHGGKGQALNAAAEANEAIVEFFLYWDNLPATMRDLYLNRVPSLGPILQRIKDPVTIAQQGVAYCVGVTGGDLRHTVRTNRQHLESSDLNQLGDIIKKELSALEKAIKESRYVLKPRKLVLSSVGRQILDLPLKDQQRLIQEFFQQDYPNLLFYILDKQPEMVKHLIKALHSSNNKEALVKQKNKQGLPLLLQVTQSYPEALTDLLKCYLDLNQEELRNQLLMTTASGESVPLIVFRQHPEAIPLVLELIGQFDKEYQLKFLLEKNTLLSALETNAEVFEQLCKIIATCSARDIAKILQLTNSRGDNFIMMALRYYPESIDPLLNLINQCKPAEQLNLLNQENDDGLNVPLLALNANQKACTHLLEVTDSLNATQCKKLFSVVNLRGESFFLRACSSPKDNFNKSLTLLDKFSAKEQSAYLQQQDHNGNNLLLLAMQHQKTPSEELISKLKSIPNEDLFQILNKKNKQGFTAFTLALIQQPEYFTSIVELTSALKPEQQTSLWKQVTHNGWTIPFLTAKHAPQHLSVVLENSDEHTFNMALNQTDAQGTSLLELSATLKAEQWPAVLEKLKKLPVAERYRLLSHCNQQGNNFLAFILFHNAPLFNDVLDLMQGFSPVQQAELVNKSNRQHQHALILAYAHNPKLLDALLKLPVLDKVPMSHWFDVLSRTCVNQQLFQTLYGQFLTIHQGNKKALSYLLAEAQDRKGNNLLMLLIKNNPSLVSIILKDIKGLDEREQRKALFQRTIEEESVLALAEKYLPDNTTASLQSMLKRLDKQGAKSILLENKIKMHTAETLISSELLEHSDPLEWFDKLSEQDDQGNQLLSQLIIRMPHRLPMILDKMQKILSSEQIQQLFAHKNSVGMNAYWVALQQPQSTYLCYLIQGVIAHYSGDAQLSLIDGPQDQSIIESSFLQDKQTFSSIMSWINGLDEPIRANLVRQFWHTPSEQLKSSILNQDLEVAQRLISTTATMSTEEIKAIMLRQGDVITAGLTSSNAAIKELMSQWLLSSSRATRFEVLNRLSAETIHSLFDTKPTSLLDTLTLEQQSQLLNKVTEQGTKVITSLCANPNMEYSRLKQKLSVFTPEQWATWLNNNPLLHVLAEQDDELFTFCMRQLRQLPIQMHFEVLSQQSAGLTLFDRVQNNPHQCEQVLRLFEHLSVTDQVKLFTQRAGSTNDTLLSRASQTLRQSLFQYFLKFPPSAQIQILLAMNTTDKNGILSLLQSSPELQEDVLNLIASFPKPAQSLIGAHGTESSNLLYWLMFSSDPSLRVRAIDLMQSVTKNDLSTLLKQKKPGNGNNLLQTLLISSPQLFDKVFSLFLNVSKADQTEILLQKNSNRTDLFVDLIEHKQYDQFEQLCKVIAELPEENKIRVLRNTNVIPINPMTRWAQLLYGAPESEQFINLLNNKAFYKPLYCLVQTLPPKAQLDILNNHAVNGAKLINSVVQPQRAELQLVMKQAKYLLQARKLLDKMAATIPNTQVHSTEFALHQQLVQRLDSYQNTYRKSMGHVQDLATGWTNDIKTAWPQIENKYSVANILIGILKIAACLLMPAYGIYKIYEKSTTSRNVFFQTDKEQIIYNLQDLAQDIEHTAKQAQIPM